MNQMQMISLDDLVPQSHPYRKLKKLINFERIMKKLKLKSADTGANGYGKERLTLCLMLQFIENLSDRECERFLQENTAGKWFADFDLTDPTPDYSTLCKFRNELGCEKIELLFKAVQTQLREKGYFSDSFKFVDATALISRFNLWEQRDEAIKAGYDKLNNENIEQFAADKDAKIGAKTANKFWYGFKKHVCVNMNSGMIENVDVTPANVTDSEGASLVLPKSGVIFADKGYVGAIDEIKRRHLVPNVILRNNMIEKDRAHDKWVSKKRAPFERTFSKQQRRVRYRGTDKNRAAEFLYAIAYNMRRLLALA